MTKSISNSSFQVAKANNSAINMDGWLGAPVLIPGEDADAFLILASGIRNALKPQDAIEHILVDDVIGLAWEVRRLRRLKGGLLLAGSRGGLSRLLSDLGMKTRQDLADKWVIREPAAVAEVESTLTTAGLSYDASMAESLSNKIDIMRAFDDLMASAESRFAARLREIERYRRGAAEMVRDIVDAEFADCEHHDDAEGGTHGE